MIVNYKLQKYAKKINIRTYSVFFNLPTDVFGVFWGYQNPESLCPILPIRSVKIEKTQWDMI